MNIEKTMEFILGMQAKNEERWAKADARFARFDKTIEFILDNQAKTEARFGKFEERFVKSEHRMDRMERIVGQNNRLVARLARAGVGLRTDIRRHERVITRISQLLAETTDKLDGLIDIVDKSQRWQARVEEKLARNDEFQVRTEENLAEITDKLNSLVDLVDKSLRRNGGRR